MLFITNESEIGLNDGDDEMMNWQSLTLSLQGRLKVKIARRITRAKGYYYLQVISTTSNTKMLGHMSRVGS